MKRSVSLLTMLGLAFAFAVTLRVALDGQTGLARAAVAATAPKLTVAHFAPFADTVAGTSVTVQVNGADFITEFVYPEVVGPVEVPSGTYTITVAPTGIITPIIEVTATVEDDTEYFLAAIGGVNGYTPTLFPLVVDRTPLTDSAQVRITHLAPFAASLPATRVDICLQDGTPVVEDLAYGDTTGYLELAPGTYDLKVAVAGTDCGIVALDLPRVALRAGQVVEIIARGLLDPMVEDALKLGLYRDGLTARVAVGHLAPFSNTVPGTAVDVWVDGSAVLTGFVYPTITPYLPLDAGEHLVQIYPEGSLAPVISQTVTISEFLDFTLAAIGDGANQPVELLALEDDNSPAPVGQMRLRVVHAAPFAGTLNGTQVDICTALNGAPVVDGFLYKQSGTLVLSPTLLSTFIGVAEPDCSGVILQLPTLALRAGHITTIFAIGDGANQPVSILPAGDLELAKSLYAPLLEKPAAE